MTGANPVFNGKYASSFSTTWGSPVHLFSQRMITAPGRKLSYKSFTNPIQPTVTQNADGSQLLEWKASEVRSVFEEDDTPGWYDTFGWVQLSEFVSWKDVVDWGLSNYDFNAPLSPELQGKIDSIAKQSTVPEDRALGSDSIRAGRNPLPRHRDGRQFLQTHAGLRSPARTGSAIARTRRFSA